MAGFSLRFFMPSSCPSRTLSEMKNRLGKTAAPALRCAFSPMPRCIIPPFPTAHAPKHVRPASSANHSSIMHHRYRVPWGFILPSSQSAHPTDCRNCQTLGVSPPKAEGFLDIMAVGEGSERERSLSPVFPWVALSKECRATMVR